MDCIEIRLSEPVIWDVTREFPAEAQRIGMNHEMKSMRDFNVYTEVPIDQCSQEDIDKCDWSPMGERDGKLTLSSE